MLFHLLTSGLFPLGRCLRCIRSSPVVLGTTIREAIRDELPFARGVVNLTQFRREIKSFLPPLTKACIRCIRFAVRLRQWRWLQG